MKVDKNLNFQKKNLAQMVSLPPTIDIFLYKPPQKIDENFSKCHNLVWGFF